MFNSFYMTLIYVIYTMTCQYYINVQYKSKIIHSSTENQNNFFKRIQQKYNIMETK